MAVLNSLNDKHIKEIYQKINFNLEEEYLNTDLTQYIGKLYERELQQNDVIDLHKSQFMDDTEDGETTITVDTAKLYSDDSDFTIHSEFSENEEESE